MNDLQKAIMEVESVNAVIEQKIKHISDLLWKNQNSKKYGGEADGSFSEEQWYNLKDITTSMDILLHRYKELTKK